MVASLQSCPGDHHGRDTRRSPVMSLTSSRSSPVPVPATAARLPRRR